MLLAPLAFSGTFAAIGIETLTGLKAAACYLPLGNTKKTALTFRLAHAERRTILATPGAQLPPDQFYARFFANFCVIPAPALHPLPVPNVASGQFALHIGAI